MTGAVAKFGKGGELKIPSVSRFAGSNPARPMRSRGVVRPIIGAFRRRQDNPATEDSPGRGFKSHREHTKCL